jgi:hypothetical protein
MNDQDLEEPVPDSVEQQQDVIPAADGPQDSLPQGIPLEASEADVAEQARELSLEEDDYR